MHNDQNRIKKHKTAYIQQWLKSTTSRLTERIFLPLKTQEQPLNDSCKWLVPKVRGRANAFCSKTELSTSEAIAVRPLCTIKNKPIMNKLIYLLLISFSLTLTNCQSQTDYVKANTSDIDKEELSLAKNLSNKILTEQKKGGYYILSSDEATSKMSEGLNEALQKKSYEQIKSMFGDYKGLKFESLMIGTKGNKYKIYRFKGYFDSESDVEVRAVLNNQKKLAGFFVKPWKENL